VRADDARRDAERATDELRAGRDRGPLHGIPFAVKDQMLVAGVRVTGGSRVLADHVADRDATVVARLKAAGAVFLGTLNTHEFHAGPTRRPPYGVARNPWDPERSPGASSSGSAVAVAAGLCTFALGGDTGGSIRGPASFCNLVGLKPTWSRVPRDGVIPLAWSLDAVGPLTRTVEDAALVLEAIAGRDARDPTSSAAPVDAYARALGPDLRGVRVGVVDEMMDPEGADAETLQVVEAAIATLASLGAEVRRVGVPLLRHAQDVATTLVLTEAASYHRKWLATRAADYDANTRVGFLTGAVLPAGVASLAARMRTAIARQVLAALADVDVLAGPAADAASPLQGAPRRPLTVATPAPYRTPLPQAFNLAGVPALSVPCGFTEAGLPIGLTLGARHFAEAKLLQVAHAYERATTWHRRWPTWTLDDPPVPPRPRGAAA
jgi:aspartyl-tRNA(Asn)/glutamyl-tRNA(Gln) amidotransferase subunit A